MKKITIVLFALIILLTGVGVFADSQFVSWNTNPMDCPGSGVGNFTTGVGIPTNGYDCWNLKNVSANPGNTVNVQLYYHNTGSQSAVNTKVYISVSPAIGVASRVHTFSSSLTASPSGTPLGITTVTLSTPQKLSFGSTYWYPNQSNTPIISGSEIITSQGLSLGTINQGWPSQGSVVVSFQVNNPPLCSIQNFTASPMQITSGNSATLNWVTNNCVSASISPSVGTVTVNGNETVFPTSTTTYILTATGANGNQVNQSRTVTVLQQNCSIQNFTASPNQINLGQSSTINWSTSNCNSVNITNIGYGVTLSGSQVVYPTHTTTFVLTAYGSSGNQQTQSVTVVVQQQSCSINNFSANPNTINSGSSSTLSWSTSNCNSVNITNIGYGVTLSGSQVVFPNYTTTFVLTAYGSSGNQQTQSVTVVVN